MDESVIRLRLLQTRDTERCKDSLSQKIEAAYTEGSSKGKSGNSSVSSVMLLMQMHMVRGRMMLQYLAIHCTWLLHRWLAISSLIYTTPQQSPRSSCSRTHLAVVVSLTLSRMLRKLHSMLKLCPRLRSAHKFRAIVLL